MNHDHDKIHKFLQLAVAYNSRIESAGRKNEMLMSIPSRQDERRAIFRMDIDNSNYMKENDLVTKIDGTRTQWALSAKGMDYIDTGVKSLKGKEL